MEIEVFNFLNLYNPKLGKLYKTTAHNPLPEDFVVDKEKIKEALTLKRMENDKVVPSFIYSGKHEIKKYFKNCYRNSAKIANNPEVFKNFSPEFQQKASLYFRLRANLSHEILSEFKSHDFDEVSAFKEIYNLNPIFGEKFTRLFEQKVEILPLIDDLEVYYAKTYAEKLKLLEKKQKQNKQNLENLPKINQKNAKKLEKTAKNIKKAENKKEIKQVKQTVKKQKINASKEKQ